MNVRKRLRFCKGDVLLELLISKCLYAQEKLAVVDWKRYCPLLSVIVVSINTLSGNDASMTTAASSPFPCSSKTLPLIPS